MKKLLLSALVLIITSISVFSQTLHGSVISETGEKLAYVTVKSLKQSKTISADELGEFAITINKLPDTLVFSSIGYKTYSVVVTDKTLKDPNFQVVLLEEKESLNEVVVVGYSASKKKMDVTGSVATISSDVLEGRAAGVSIGYPGSSSHYKIRGATSFDKGVSAEPDYTNNSKDILADSSLIDSKTYKTRQLTAGELNDFNKWKMWEDFSGNEFRTLSESWDLYANRRFCVQVQNEQFAPVVGREVYLLNSKTKDTLWKAVTDVTGKAELWAGLHDQKEIKNFIIACNDYSNILTQPTEFTNGINNITLKMPCVVSNAVDIAFVVDATGSMGDEIEYLKNELEDILKRTFARYADLDVNAASVFYRDKGDAYIVKQSDFNNDLVKTLNFIKLQHAGGGGDMPEAVNTALETAINNLAWRNNTRAKLLFMVLDAPPHDDAKEEMYTLIKQAAGKGIRIIPIVCSDADKSTEFMMRTIALATNGTYIFLTDNSGIGNSHIKPTTDVYTVELLNSLIQRVIQQMIYVRPCNDTVQTEPSIKIPNNILKLTIAPNPTRGNVSIITNKKIKELYVTDYTGKILMKLNPAQKNIQFSLINYPNGTYLIKYITEDNQWGAEKVVLAH